MRNGRTWPSPASSCRCWTGWSISPPVRPAGDVDAQKPLPPVAMLDGFGRLAGVPAGVLPISGKDLQESKIGPQHPPGFYGESKARLALNLSGAVKTLTPLGHRRAAADPRPC